MLLLLFGLFALSSAGADGLLRFDRLSVCVGGRSVPVQSVRCSAFPMNRRWPGHQRTTDQTEICGLARFTLEAESATVDLTVNEPFTNVVVRPISKGVRVVRNGSDLRLEGVRRGQYSVEIDGWHRNLHLFVDPARDFGVDRNDPKVRYFGPGRHEAGLITLRSGETLYLDADAVVCGRVLARDADDIRILGYGMIDASGIRERYVRNDPEKDRKEREAHVAVANAERDDTIRLEFCDRVRIEGVTIRDSLIYNIRPVGCRDLEIANVKTVGNWRYNSDGFDMHNCERVTIRDSFLRTFDDAICVKGFDCWMNETEMAHDGYVHDVFRDVLVTNCTVWCDWGKCFEIGAETRAREMFNVKFCDCDAIRTCGPACDVTCIDYADVHDISFENIRVEYGPDRLQPMGQEREDARYVDRGKGLWASGPMGAYLGYHFEYSADGKRRGRIRNVLYRDIRVTGDRMPESVFTGYDADHRVTGVVVDGLYLNGRRLDGAREANVRCGNEFADPVTFATRQEPRSVTSPDGRTTASVGVGERLTWRIVRDGRTLLDAGSRLGLRFGGKPEMKGFSVVSERTAKVDDVFTTRFSRREKVDLHANELTLGLKAEDGQELGLVLRAYDGSVAFRYVIPGEEEYVVEREQTSWAFPGNPEAWMSFYPANDKGELFGACGSEEGTFNKARINMIPKNGVIGVPAIVDCGETRMAICEADLTDWSALWFWTDNPWAHRRQTATLFARSPNVPGQDYCVRGQARRVSPWRVMILSETDAGLLENNDVISALNPAPEGGEEAFDWVKPGVTGWDWWADHAGIAVSPTTDATLGQVDFAAEMGWPYHTIDAGWYGRPVKDADASKGTFVKLEPRADYDLEKILAHAKERNVGIWLWLWWDVLDNPANGLERTFAKFEKWGVKGVKIDFMDRGDQEMVNWYERVVRCAAKHRLLVNFHAAYHPTGMNRTWPNQITREGICGNEMNKFYGWVTPEHMATLPFTRFLVGPGDYTPGSFGNVYTRNFVCQNERERMAGANAPRVFPQEIGTRAHVLALCVAYDSPLMTLCDWPENYRGQPGVEALRNLPTTWKRTIPFKDSKIGENYTVLREAPDGDWYFAAFTVKARTVRLPFFAMGEGDYEATVYADDPEKTPKDATALRIFTKRFSHREAMELALCDEGGCLVKIRRLSKPVEEAKPLKVLVLGNSITMHPKCGKFVGGCGMCASAPEKDFVHLVARGLENRLGRKVEFLARNIAGFEADFGLAEMGRRDPMLNAKAPRWKENHADNLAVELALKADVVIFAIGENVWRVKGEDDRTLFMKEFTKLVELVKANSNPLVLVRAPFWTAEWPRTWAMERVAKAQGCFYVDAGPLDDLGSTRALGFTGISGVDAHPGDKGMRLMAEQMLESLTGR